MENASFSKVTKRLRLKQEDVVSISKWLVENRETVLKRHMTLTEIKHIIEKTFGIKAQEQSIERIARKVGVTTDLRKTQSHDGLMIVAQALFDLFKELGTTTPDSLSELLKKSVSITFNETEQIK